MHRVGIHFRQITAQLYQARQQLLPLPIYRQPYHNGVSTVIHVSYTK